MDSFARLRSKFLASTSFNSKSRPDSETQDFPGIHLPYLVCLLQTAGYHLGKVECINPKYMTQKGTSIVLSCGHSGQRCALYSPEEQDMCNCFIKGEDSSNFFLEAVSQGHLEERWLVENGSAQYCLPFISDDLKLLCRTVILELVTMMKDSYKTMSGAKMEPPQDNSGPFDSTVAIPQNSQESTCLALGTRTAVPNDSTFILHTEMSRDLQKQTVTVSSEESNFEQSTEYKTESWKTSTVCSAVSVMTESVSQTSSTISKSPKPSPLPVENVPKINTSSTRLSLIPKTSLCTKGKSTSNLKVLSGNISTSKDHRSPLSISNSKSTPNLSTGTTGVNKKAGSQLKGVLPNKLSFPQDKRVTPQLKKPSEPKRTISSAGPPRPSTPRVTPLKNTSLKIPVRGNSIAYTEKSKSTSSVSSAVSSTPTSSRYKKTTVILKEKSEKVVQVTAKGCFSCKK